MSVPFEATPKPRLIEVDQRHADQRIDNFLLTQLKGVPKSHIYRILRTGEVRINGGRCQAPRKLQLGDVVRVPLGEAFPADGQLLDGHTAADEALLTGEATPVPKAAGDTVVAFDGRGTERTRGLVSLRRRGFVATWAALRRRWFTAAPASVGTATVQEGPLVFASPAAPRASIIIPVHGKLEFTLTCLRSLASTGNPSAANSSSIQLAWPARASSMPLRLSAPVSGSCRTSSLALASSCCRCGCAEVLTCVCSWRITEATARKRLV